MAGAKPPLQITDASESVRMVFEQHSQQESSNGHILNTAANQQRIHILSKYMWNICAKWTPQKNLLNKSQNLISYGPHYLAKT